MDIHHYLASTMQRWGSDSMLVRAALRYSSRGVRLHFCNGQIDVVRDRAVIRLAARHLAYVPDVAHNFDRYFTQVEPIEDGDRMLVDFSQPRLHRYRGSGLQFEFTSLVEEIDALDGYFRWYTPQPGDTVFDIGAYCGASVYRLSTLVGTTGKVVAFEPDPLNFQLLERNLARHGVSNVVSVAAAVADYTGTAAFFAEGALGSTITTHSSRGSASEKVEVITLTLADACERYGTPSFAKVDIEGAEIAMLESARSFLAEHPIHFALDTNHNVGKGLTAPAVEDVFRSIGYRTESSDSSGCMTTWASPS